MTPSTKSTPESGPAENDSVFDFLYHDPRRIASFLGQFDPNGVVQSLKRADQSSDTSVDTSTDGMKLNVGVVAGQLGQSNTATIGSSKSSERTYDPLWSHARAFLDYLHQSDMIEDDVYRANIGQFVLFSGSLVIADIAALKEAWKLPTIRKLLGASEPAPSKYKNSSSSANKQPTEAEFAFEMLGILPHSVQAIIHEGATKIWSTLNSDCLVTNSSEITLKHGMSVPGQWNILGILDAQPDDGADLVEVQSGPNGEQAAWAFVSALAPLTRMFMGRPTDAFGVTPLLIFREVHGR